MGFGKDARFYDIPDVGRLVSVTTVLSVISKPALYKWHEKQGAKKAYDLLAMLRVGAPVVHDWILKEIPVDFLKGGGEIAEAAAATGTEAHKIIERVLKGETVDLEQVPAESRSSVSRFLEFTEHEPFEILHSETRVHSAKYGYAGTVDAIVKVGDRNILRDWKTSKGIWPEYLLQGVAYQMAAEECLGIAIDDVEIIRFSKTGEPFDPVRDVCLIPREWHDYLFEKFRSALDLWRWQYKMDFPSETDDGIRELETIETAVSSNG